MKPIPRSLTIGIGCFNDEDTIRSVLQDAMELSERVETPIDVLIIDDGSCDGTNRTIKEFRSTMPSIRLIEHPKNQGYASTLKELYALSIGEALFTCPGDGQIMPTAAMSLWDALKHADVVVGLRRPRHDSFKRRVQSRGYRALLNGLFKLGIEDPNSSKLWRRSAYASLTLNSKSPFIEAESLIQAKDRGFIISESPIPHHPRRHGKGSGGSWKSIRETWREAIQRSRLTRTE